MLGFNGTLRTASKLAWRNLKRTRVHSILVIALTIVPFAVATYVSVESQSAQATPAEKIDYQLGAANNRLQAQASPGADWYQSPDNADLSWTPKTVNERAATLPKDSGERIDPRTVMAGKDVVILRSLENTWKTKNGLGSILSVEGQYWSPKFGSDKFAKIVSGTTPKVDNEVMISPTALRRFGVSVGDTITRILDSKSTQSNLITSFKVVGVLQAAEYPNQDVVFAPKLFGSESAGLGTTLYYFFDGKPLGWSRVLELNKLGLAVLSRAVLANPPALIDQPLITINQPNLSEEELAAQTGGGGFWRFAWLGILAFYSAMILIPIAVIVSAAFMFGARRQTHSLAILSSVGATKRTIRAVTMVSALLLTMVGSLLGMAIGVSAAAIILPQKSPDWHRFAGLHIDWLWILAFVVMAVVLAFMVGFVPAEQSTKIKVLSVLRGTNLPTRLKIRTGLASLLMLAGSSAFLIAASIWQRYQYQNQLPNSPDLIQWLSIGISLAQITLMLSFVVGSGWVIRAVSALLLVASKWFKSFTVRFAARDLMLSRRRFSPLVSAMGVVAFIATAAISSMNASALLQASLGQSQALGNQVFFDANQQVTQYTKTDNGMSYGVDETRRTPAQVEGMRLELVSTSNTIVASGILGKTPDPWSLSAQTDPKPIAMAHLDQFDYCVNYSASSKATITDSNQAIVFARRACENDPADATRFVVGDVNGLRLMSGGAINPEAEKVLTEGGFVAFDSIYAKKGSVDIERVQRNDLFSSNADGTFKLPKVISSTTLKSIMNPSIQGHFFAFTGMMSPSTAAKLGIAYSDSLIVLKTSKMVSSDLADRWMQAGFSPVYDRGYGVDPADLIFWGNLIVLGLVLLISGLAVGLSQLEARNDQRTLSRLGATRRFLGAATALQLFMLLAVSSALGALGGELLSRNVYRGSSTVEGTSPWQFYLLLILVAPLIASLIAFFATPSSPERKAKVAIE